MVNKYKRLVDNSFLFAIGNFGSKLITFFMLPLYTWKMTQSDFGVSDLVLTTVSLLLPIVSLSVFDAVLRYSLDDDSNDVSILSNSFLITLIGSVVLTIIIPIVRFLQIEYSTYVILILIVQMYQTLFSQYAKAINKVKIFAINGIILSFLTAMFNIILLIFLDLGIEGYLLSILISNILSTLWLWGVLNIYKNLNFSMVSITETIKLLKYSGPLIPNGIAFWITNTVSRYFILFFLGTAANGLFAVANKIPSLLNVLNTIFFQAWQLSAIEEFDSKDSSKFYSEIFSSYSKFLFIGVSGILLVLRPMMKVLVSDEFFLSWKYVPFLLMTVVYSSFSGFLGNYYAAAKHTQGVFSTTIYGSIINIMGNFLLVPTLGLNGAGLSSAISFFFLWIIRQKDTQKYVTTEIDASNLIENHLVIFLQIFCLYWLEGIAMFFIEFLTFCLILYINRQLVVKFIKIIFPEKVK